MSIFSFGLVQISLHVTLGYSRKNPHLHGGRNGGKSHGQGGRLGIGGGGGYGAGNPDGWGALNQKISFDRFNQ